MPQGSSNSKLKKVKFLQTSYLREVKTPFGTHTEHPRTKVISHSKAGAFNPDDLLISIPDLCSTRDWHRVMLPSIEVVVRCTYGYGKCSYVSYGEVLRVEQTAEWKVERDALLKARAELRAEFADF